jgi:hypothetical protein
MKFVYILVPTALQAVFNQISGVLKQVSRVRFRKEKQEVNER